MERVKEKRRKEFRVRRDAKYNRYTDMFVHTEMDV